MIGENGAVKPDLDQPFAGSEMAEDDGLTAVQNAFASSDFNMACLTI
jgi:hypothetical protein